MPLSCLSCRRVVEVAPGPVPGRCPACGGELVGVEGAWIEWSGSAGEGKSALLGDAFSIGRRSHCDLTLGDDRVSKNHACLRREGRDWYVRDGCSVNGTLINGKRVAEKLLEDGDIVSVGGTELRFHADGAPEGTGGITVVPLLDPEEAVQACLPCGPGDFMPADEVADPAEIRADYERLRIAYLFGQELGRARSEHDLVEHILRFAFDLLPADRGAVLLREDEQAPLTLAAARRREADGTTRPAGEDIVIPVSILRRALEEHTAVLSGDATVDLRFERSQSVLRESIRSAMCVPLVGEHGVVGAVHLDTREATGAFSVKDLRILNMVAAQAAPVLERYCLLRRLERETLTRERLSRFLAPEVVEEVVERGLALDGAGKTGRVTVLFCDIRGFSGLAERTDPRQLVRMLNAFFEQMVEVIFRHQGVLDKFIGDAIMAVWGAPIRRDDDARRAIQAGSDILQAADRFNQGSRGQGWPALQVGVGVNSGEAVIGLVGSSRRMEYTVMGDTVNLAARVCNLARGGQLLLTGEVLEEARRGGARPVVQPLPPAQVRGRKAPVHIYEFEACPQAPGAH